MFKIEFKSTYSHFILKNKVSNKMFEIFLPIDGFELKEKTTALNNACTGAF